ncbi:MAG: hypothetical protein K0R98_462 [Rickettsiaceae bacterium]|jgi:hypothetical protein|nr:hypothetical protein [Rickettsiaceae bacterium]
MYNLSTQNIFKALLLMGMGYVVYQIVREYTHLQKAQGIADREDLSEKDIDEMVKASFPASDPPSTY